MSSTVNVSAAFSDGDMRDALKAGADKLLEGARRRVPKRSGALAENGQAIPVSSSLALVTFSKVYAAKQERRDDSWRKYRYTHTNGQPHFLRDSADLDGDAIFDAIGSRLFGGE